MERKEYSRRCAMAAGDIDGKRYRTAKRYLVWCGPARWSGYQAMLPVAYQLRYRKDGTITHTAVLRETKAHCRHEIPLDFHHIFGGNAADRKKCKRYGLKVRLCRGRCHIFGPEAAHNCAETMRTLRRYGQRKVMIEQGWTVDEFRFHFSKNYLDEELEEIAAAVDAGITGWEMCKSGRNFHAGDGLVGEDVEKTITNISRLARLGMRETDEEILRIMTDAPAVERTPTST